MRIPLRLNPSVIKNTSLVGQRHFFRSISKGVALGYDEYGLRPIGQGRNSATSKSVSEGLCLTRSLAYASGYYFGKNGDVQLLFPVNSERSKTFELEDSKT